VCAGCGRRWAAAPSVPLLWLRRLGAVATITPLPYGALKTAWGLGWHGGLQDPNLFDGVTLLSPGFGDTAVLAGVGVAAAVAMARPARGRILRAGLVLVGTIGSTMLLPVGVLGSGSVIGAYLGVVDVTENGMHLWVFLMVYGGFLLWGLALAPLTFLHLRAARADCGEHEGDAREVAPAPGSARSSRAVGTMDA